jgi:hypothetical protein
MSPVCTLNPVESHFYETFHEPNDSTYLERNTQRLSDEVFGTAASGRDKHHDFECDSVSGL